MTDWERQARAYRAILRAWMMAHRVADPDGFRDMCVGIQQGLLDAPLIPEEGGIREETRLRLEEILRELGAQDLLLGNFPKQ